MGRTVYRRFHTAKYARLMHAFFAAHVFPMPEVNCLLELAPQFTLPHPTHIGGLGFILMQMCRRSSHTGDLFLNVRDGWVNSVHTDYPMCNRCAASPSPRVQSDSAGCLNQPSSTHTPTVMMAAQMARSQHWKSWGKHFRDVGKFA